MEAKQRDRNRRTGASKPPYKEWQWHDIGQRLGGPNFLRLPDGSLWAVSRSYPGGPKTVLARLSRDSYEPVLTLPSGGDTSYAGLVWHDDLLWISYYSSHEGKASIYLAKVRVPPAPAPESFRRPADRRAAAVPGLVRAAEPGRHADAGRGE